MVREGLRSLQNGRASLPHYPPPSRKAGKPKGREAEKLKGGNPGSRGAEKAEMPIVLRSDRSNETACAFTSHYRYAT